MSQFLNYAINLAQMVDGQTGINPPVGAVVVRDGRIVGLGAHLQHGDKHAEVQALDMAKSQAEGATIYVSLEPCTHFGTTPPCVNKIIESGITKVIYAMKDTTLSSNCDEVLSDAGIEVDYRYQEAAANLYKGFFIAKNVQRPEVTVKVSCSLDGKQATDSAQSKWITNKRVKQDVFNLRHQHDAVLTGKNTIEHDNPQYTTRIEDGKNPIKVILSKSGTIDMGRDIFTDPQSKVWIYTENKQLSSETTNVEVITLDDCSLNHILSDLYQRGIGKLLVEAGPTVTSEFLQSSMVNELILYYAPKVIGGSGKYQFYQTDNVFELSDIPNFEIVNSELLEQNIKLELRKK